MRSSKRSILPGGPTGIAVGQGGVWVANSLDASVSHIDPESGDVLATIAVGDAPVDVAVDDTGVWVANSTSGTVSRIDPTSDLEVQTVPVGNGPRAIAAGPEGVWVANFLDGTVARVDPEANAVVQAIPRRGGADRRHPGGRFRVGVGWIRRIRGRVRARAEAATSVKLGSQANDVASVTGSSG